MLRVINSLVTAATPPFVSCLQGGGGGAGGGVAGSHAGQTQLPGVSARPEAHGRISAPLRNSVHLCSKP